ncbi:MAG: transcription-repair coupling factor [Flavobacteriaceae bacterium]|nr:transcription-repair coupling factor [Flavobacteriaceae bacterium]
MKREKNELIFEKKIGIESLITSFSNTQNQKALEEQLLEDDACVFLKGSVGSGISFIIANSFKTVGKTMLYLCEDREKAAYQLNDFERILGEDNVLFFPSSYRKPYQTETTDNANVLLRSEVLTKLGNSKKPKLIVSYPQAVFEKVVSHSTLKKNTLEVIKDSRLSLDFVNEMLFEYRFNRVDFVTQPGEFSVRGGIIDVFSFSNQHPYRIEFYDDQVESLRSFDVATQLSISTLNKIKLLPNTSEGFTKAKRKSIIEVIAPKGVLITQNFDFIAAHLAHFYEEAEASFAALATETKHLPPDVLFISKENFIQTASMLSLVSLTKSTAVNTQQNHFFKQSPQPAFNRQFDRLIVYLNDNHQKGYQNFICCASEQQAQRFKDIFEEGEETVHYKTLVNPLFEGFEDVDAKVACFTDHQIFERYHKYQLKTTKAKKEALTLKELTHLEVGDYVTHIDHGIGTFGGLQKIDVEGKQQEAIKLVYADRDILYLSIHSLHKISRFNGKDGKVPKVYKLGSSAWKSLKQKTKTRLKQIAFNLIELYAKRHQKIGYACDPDSYLQHELEASFIFEDTPDQSTATADVKKDMESEQPMDRLVCGDVGFGKTEVAIRAAFKAVDNSKQVAVLVPTTILAFQHFKNFSKRLSDLPVRVDYLNRFRSTKDKKQIIEDLKLGKIDVLIGTHQLVGKQVEFKDLGLLIVDEEQKFGVAVKEKLRALKTNVDVLTLTATPIPRTLQFSLMAARDMSVIATAPPNRYPIESEVVRFDEELIRDSISYEIQRGGQVFFIHNRVENITEVAGMLQRLVPDARIRVGHGQLDGKKLEGNLLQFMDGSYDILVATTIIENGLDVPNANTIFINNAQNFGLSDLHQMRGRVGRSNKKAFCYFITPPDSAMSSDAQKRIQAIEQFAALGSGIQIAMKDLEIRGAGDLLGGEQSGFINDIGFDTYQKILKEAIEELKENEFKSLYSDKEEAPKAFVKEIQIDTDLEVLFPDDYINIVSERLTLYNRLATLKEEADLVQYQKEIEDRFGPLPLEAEALLDSVRLKWKAAHLGIDRLLLKKKQCIGYFIADQESPFYQSDRFHALLVWVQQHATQVNMKEKQTKGGLRLRLAFKDIHSVQQALQALPDLK